MNKKQMITALRDARKAHQTQMYTVNSMIKGITVKEELVLDKDKCGLGKWLYNEDNRLKHILGSQFYVKLEQEHIRWHSECHKISEILSTEENRGFISKMLNSKKSNRMKAEKATIYFDQLKIQTEELLKILTSSERRLEALHDSKFEI